MNELHVYLSARNGKEQGAERVILWVKKKGAKEEYFNNIGASSSMLIEIKKRKKKMKIRKSGLLDQIS